VLVVTCTLLLGITTLIGGGLMIDVCLSADRVVRHMQAWRLLTSSLFHTGGIHLLFNMVALLQVGVPLERLLGSVQLSWLVATLSVLSNCLYVGLALAAGLPPLGWSQPSFQCVLGFSGVLFGLIVVHAEVAHIASYSLFGAVTIPARAYPWLLLAACQLMVPHVSFLGHLSGLLVGQALALGLLRLAMPSPATVATLESWSVVQRWGLPSSDPGATLRAMPDAGVAGAHLLPISTASHGGGLLEGLWQPYPPALVPGTPPAPPPILRTPSMSIVHQCRAGQGPEAAAAAAAAAAEARLAGTKGHGAGPRKGGPAPPPAPL
ncbi:hypothetical protein APUTEX25_001584, partial [Auxenochlorella protothecoides]